VWDTATGKQIAKMDHDFPVNSVTFTPDGKAVITFGSTGVGYRWDIEKLAEAQRKK
jgi:WD40 repeat protein